MRKTFIAIGELNQKIAIEKPPTTVDSLNQKTGEWAVVCSVFAKVLPVRGREFFDASQVQSESTYKFTIRYRADVKAGQRIVWNDARYDIISEPMLLDGLKNWMEILASSGVRNAY